MHYTVRLLLEHRIVPRCKILENGDLVKRTNRWVWILWPGTPVAEYEIMEHAPDNFEKRFLHDWLQHELTYKLGHSEPGSGNPETIIGEFLHFLLHENDGSA